MPRAATHAARAGRGVGASAPAVPRRTPTTRPAPGRRHAPAPRRPPHQTHRRRAPTTVAGVPARPAGGVLDRLLRGRGLILLVGALLAGIVFLNVSLLELNGAIGAMSERATELRHQNAQLRLEAARLGASERIQRLAEEAGFAMPRPGEVTYLEPDRGADARHAARSLDRAQPPPTPSSPDAAAQVLAPSEPAG